jgi:hypothetical protein
MAHKHGGSKDQGKGSEMKRIMAAIGVVAVLGGLVAGEAWAQKGMRWRGSGGWASGSPYVRLYDPKTVETINGEIVSVDAMAPMKGMSPGLHLTVKTDKETLSVHLGPAWYVENQDVKLAPKDKVEIKGSRITFAGKPALVAAEVKKGDQTLMLRDGAGIPMWSAWRRG